MGVASPSLQNDAASWLGRAIKFASRAHRSVGDLAAACLLHGCSNRKHRPCISSSNRAVCNIAWWHKGSWLGRFNRLFGIDSSLAIEDTVLVEESPEDKPALSGPVQLSQDVCTFHTARLILGTRLGIETRGKCCQNARKSRLVFCLSRARCKAWPAQENVRTSRRKSN